MIATKKDFELMAKIIKHNIEDNDPRLEKKYTVKEVMIAQAKQIADVLAQSNDRFDKKRFLKACGIE